jgi:hypothetical protein
MSGSISSSSAQQKPSTPDAQRRHDARPGLWSVPASQEDHRGNRFQGREPRGRARPAHPGRPDHRGGPGRRRLNDSHIFNQRWPSHARFHGVVALAMTSSLSGLNLWSLWSASTDRRISRLFVAAIPVGYWTPFFGGTAGPGCWGGRSAASDPPGRGVPTRLMGAAATSLTAAAGWLLGSTCR